MNKSTKQIIRYFLVKTENDLEVKRTEIRPTDRSLSTGRFIERNRPKPICAETKSPSIAAKPKSGSPFSRFLLLVKPL